MLTEEPFWQSFVGLLDFARQHTIASVWSCLAAHAAALSLDGIERQRLPEKCCGVYEHSILTGHPLLSGVSAPLPMPHSRWNELPPAALQAAGYTLLSWSPETGADAFVREERSLLLHNLRFVTDCCSWWGRFWVSRMPRPVSRPKLG